LGQLFAIDSPLRVIIATTTVGLGITCPDVSHVVHFGLHSDVESYIQETGRAGRDGFPITCCFDYQELLEFVYAIAVLNILHQHH